MNHPNGGIYCIAEIATILAEGWLRLYQGKEILKPSISLDIRGDQLHVTNSTLNSVTEAKERGSHV